MKNEIIEYDDDEMIDLNYEELIDDEWKVEPYRSPMFLQGIFEEHAIKIETYYLINQCSVSEIEWLTALEGDDEIYKEVLESSYVNQIFELYTPEEPLPFDMNAEGKIKIFGLKKFEAFGEVPNECEY